MFSEQKGMMSECMNCRKEVLVPRTGRSNQTHKSFSCGISLMVTKEQVIEKLKTCYDPELNIDVWTLEIIYDVQVSGNDVYIKMTFTTPFCPYGGVLVREIETKVGELEGVKNVRVDIVFEPPWKPSDELLDMMSMGVR